MCLSPQTVSLVVSTVPINGIRRPTTSYSVGFLRYSEKVQLPLSSELQESDGELVYEKKFDELLGKWLKKPIPDE